MRLWRYIIILVIAVVCTVSHSKAQPWVEKLHVEGVAKVSHLSTSGMNLWVTINNESCYRYVIKSCEVDIHVEGRHMATVMLRDEVVIPRKSTKDVLLPLRFKARSSFALGRLVWRMIESGGKDITISYRMRAGLRLVKRNFKEENIALSDILGNRPSTMEALEDLWDMIK